MTQVCVYIYGRPPLQGRRLIVIGDAACDPRPVAAGAAPNTHSSCISWSATRRGRWCRRTAHACVCRERWCRWSTLRLEEKGDIVTENQ